MGPQAATAASKMQKRIATSQRNAEDRLHPLTGGTSANERARRETRAPLTWTFLAAPTGFEPVPPP